MFLGIFDIDEYVPIPAATHRFSSGAAYAPTSLTYSIYEEGSTTGTDEDVDMTPASPFDSVTGAYYVRRQLTAAAGFERGKTYMVLIKATVDSVAAIEWHTFQIRQQPAWTSADIKATLDGETVDIGKIIGTALTETSAGYLAAGIKKLFDVATPVLTAASVNQTGDLYAKIVGTSAAVATDAGNSATAFKTTLTEAANDYWKDCLLKITSGTMAKQVKRVSGYNGTTKVITVVGGFTATPADAVTFDLIDQ